MDCAIRVFISGNSRLTIIALRTILSTQEDIDIIGEATNWQGIHHSGDNKSIILIDIDTLKAAMKSNQNSFFEEFNLFSVNNKIILLINDIDTPLLLNLMFKEKGVRGGILKEDCAQLLSSAIRSVAQGGTCFSLPVTDMLIQSQHTSQRSNEIYQLAPIEKRLLEKIAQGQKNALIARELSLAEQTVRNYISRLYTTLNIHSRAEAIIWAMENGIGENHEYEEHPAIPDYRHHPELCGMKILPK